MPNVSIFKNVGTVTNPINQDIMLYLEDTRNGKYEDIVTPIRLLTDEAEIKASKQKIPTTTLSGLFAYRADKDILEHTGKIAMDLDDLKDLNAVKSALKLDKYVFSVFMSTGGRGLRVLFNINPKKHRESWFGIANYLKDTYGVISDPKGVNPSKPFLVSYDPDLWINTGDCPVWTSYPKERVIKKITNFVYTKSDFCEVLEQIKNRNVAICDTYDDWLKCCFAISEHFREDGRDYFHLISQCHGNYNYKLTDDQYSYCLKSKGDGVGISSFYYLAKLKGISIVTEQTKTIVRVTRNGKKAGLSKEQIEKNLAAQSIPNAGEVVNKVFESTDKFDNNKEDSIIDQMEMFVTNNYNLLMNEVTGYLENDGKKMSQNDLNTMFVTAKKNITKLDYQLMMRLLKSDFVPQFNPFLSFLGSDGVHVELPATPDENAKVPDTPLINLLAKTLDTEDNEHTEYFLRKWYVSIVSAMHKVHSPQIFSLLGEGGTGKTEWLRRLLPKILSLEYYGESKLEREKDDELLMCECILLMNDELGGKTKQDSLKLKDMSSKQWFSLRRPYGDHNEKVLRYAVLCGTSNILTVLNDSTSINRREVPIHVKDINKELYNSIDKTALLMEAFRIYKEGFDWRINQKDTIFLNKDGEKYEVLNFERELISKYYQVPKAEEESTSDRLSASEMILELEKFTRKNISIHILGKELTKLGFRKISTRRGLESTKKWAVIKIGRSLEGPATKPPEDTPF